MQATLYLIAATTTTVAGGKKSNSSSFPLLIIIVAFAAVYFLFIRPRQQRLRQQQTAARQLEIGDEVVTAGGIHGRLVGLSDDTAEVEVSPGVVITFLRRAVNAKPASSGSSATDAEEDYHQGAPPHDDDSAHGEPTDPTT